MQSTGFSITAHTDDAMSGLVSSPFSSQAGNGLFVHHYGWQTTPLRQPAVTSPAFTPVPNYTAA